MAIKVESTDILQLNKTDNSLITTFPHSNEAEALFLGCVLYQENLFDDYGYFNKEYFFSSLHQEIFSEFKELYNKGQYSYEVLSEILRNKASFQDITNYLTLLLAQASSYTNVSNFAKIIHDRFIRRQLILACHSTVNKLNNLSENNDARKEMENLEIDIFNIAESENFKEPIISFNDSAFNAISTIEESKRRKSSLSGLTTGFKTIDTHLFGLHRSDLIILAARPSMGKTALAINIALGAAEAYREYEEDGKSYTEGGNVLFFSLEMSNEQLSTRILSHKAGVDAQKIRAGNLSNTELTKLKSAQEKLANLPLFIDDTAESNVVNLFQKARRFKRKNNNKLDLIIIDYLQLLKGSSKKRWDSKVQEITEISRELKILAKNLNVPVLALSQLSREVERRDDKRPQLSDLRESGAIEQDADIVLFLYREYYYLVRSSPKRKESDTEASYTLKMDNYESLIKEKRKDAELSIAKNRHGRTEIVLLLFNEEIVSFSDGPTSH